MNENYEFVEKCYQNTIFGKTIKDYSIKLEALGQTFLIDADFICKTGLDYLNSQHPSEDIDIIIKSYFIKFIAGYVKEYNNFKKTFSYSASNKTFEDIRSEIYDNDDYMNSYLVTLLFTYAFFPHHYYQYSFFKKYAKELNPSKVLEFGSGHGLFTKLISSYLKDDGSYEAVEISKIGNHMTAEINREMISKSVVSLISGDATKYAPLHDLYDLMVMAGFLEHIPYPKETLRHYSRFLNDQGGGVLIMLPINTPVPDHMIHFKTDVEVDEFIESCGLCIFDKLIIPTEEVSIKQALEDMSPILHISYCKKRG